MRTLLLGLAAASLVACHSSSSGSGDAGCDQLLEQAASELAPAEAEQSCTKDSDCVFASTSVDCIGGYSCGLIVNQAGAAALDAAVAQVNATTCATFAARGCVTPSALGNPLLPCAPSVGYCVAGQCNGFPPPPEDAGTATPNPVCAEEADAAQTAVALAVATARLDCDADSDCTLVSSATACSGDCSTALVNQASAPQLQQALARISATDCPDFLDGGCPFSLFPCAPNAPFGCFAGSCAFGVSAELDAGIDAGDGAADAASD
jgi:hypothetical protein